MVELLKMEHDPVVRAVATCLRNLAIDPRNKELIGKQLKMILINPIPKLMNFQFLQNCGEKNL